MQLRNPEHHDIFYPSDSQTVRQLCDMASERADDLPMNCQAARLPAALLAPHAAWQWVLPQLRQVLAAARTLQPKLIVLLAPLHGQVVLSDRPKTVFMPSQDGATTPIGMLPFACAERDSIVGRFPAIASVEDSYFTEEPAAELFFPLLVSAFPGVPALPLLADDSCNAARTRELSELLLSLLEREAETLFIVTANMSEETNRRRALEQARSLESLLGRGKPLLDAKAKGTIGGCGVPWLDAIERLPWKSNGWMMLSTTDDGKTFHTEVPEQDTENDDKRSVVWHGAALHR
ncbi:MAG: AmmeMemoRadiSam system protein B [Sphaerochaetaceae bacterium]|jgi:AmmeMemoRadiSam system protein B